MSNPLANTAMLVSLNLHNWPARAIDREATQQVAEENDANERYTRVSKTLLDREALKTINTICQDARKAHKEYTLPFNDSEYRLLPVKMYNEYTQTINNYQEMLVNARNALITNYDQHIVAARKLLGSLFNQDDYPPPQELAERITMEYSFMQIPDAQHLVLDMAREEQEILSQRLQKDMELSLHRAVQDIYGRVRTATANLAERLDSDEEGNPKRFYQKRLTDLQNIVEAIPKLNLTNDQTLAQVHQELTNTLQSLSIEDLKPNGKTFSAEKRQDLSQTMASISRRMAGYMGATDLSALRARQDSTAAQSGQPGPDAEQPQAAADTNFQAPASPGEAAATFQPNQTPPPEPEAATVQVQEPAPEPEPAPAPEPKQEPALAAAGFNTLQTSVYTSPLNPMLF